MTLCVICPRPATQFLITTLGYPLNKCEKHSTPSYVLERFGKTEYKAKGERDAALVEKML